MQQTNKQLLVVDDSAVVIKRLTRALREMLKNTDIVAVLKGADALHTLHEIRPSVVVLDIQLPDISGIELLKEIRATYPNTKVIMLTNQSAPHVRQTCLHEGAEGFYDKTKEFEKALEHIKKLD